jgi:hypothetical protein
MGNPVSKTVGQLLIRVVMALDYPAAVGEDHPPQRVDLRARCRKSAHLSVGICALLPMFCFAFAAMLAT